MRSPRKLNRTIWLLAALSVALLLGACTSILERVSPPTATSQPPTDAEASPTPEGPEANSEASGPITINLWLPARFDPNNGSVAATLMQEHLAAFTAINPNVRVEVRLKAESGESSMLTSLLAAQEAAPLALPDLVLLHSDLLPDAVEAGLLRANEGMLASLDEDDWYPYAQQMAAWQESNWVLPFVGDGLVLAYRATAIEPPPATWEELFDSQATLAFAAADPLATYPVSQYINIPGEPEAALAELYEFVAQAQASGNFPVWLTQYQTLEQSWQAFMGGQAPMVAAWSNLFLSDTSQSFQAAPLPVRDEEAGTMVKGWSWAITTMNSDRVEVVAELAAFLNDAEFMSQWSAAAGYLPARPSALAAWAPGARQALASQIAPDAILAPSFLQQPLLGPSLSEAILALLKQEITPAEAVEQSLEDLQGP